MNHTNIFLKDMANLCLWSFNWFVTKAAGNFHKRVLLIFFGSFQPQFWPQRFPCSWHEIFFAWMISILYRTCGRTFSVNFFFIFLKKKHWNHQEKRGFFVVFNNFQRQFWPKNHTHFFFSLLKSSMIAGEFILQKNFLFLLISWE